MRAAATPARIREVAERLAGLGSGCAFTGAGISVESGIPDFRSADGIWSRYDPFEVATLDAFQRDPERVWAFLYELDRECRDKPANPAHTALASLERAGWLTGIVTQNIDGLHQRGGSERVIEVHGNGEMLRCLACDERYPMERARAIEGESLPRCACGAVLKPDVVLFGEALPELALQDAFALARRAEAMLVVGTQATVYPAAGVPRMARQSGAIVVELNLEPTALTGSVAHHTLLGQAGEVLPALARALLAARG